jgi:hypothetical protein
MQEMHTEHNFNLQLELEGLTIARMHNTIQRSASGGRTK